MELTWDYIHGRQHPTLERKKRKKYVELLEEELTHKSTFFLLVLGFIKIVSLGSQASNMINSLILLEQVLKEEINSLTTFLEVNSKG